MSDCAAAVHDGVQPEQVKVCPRFVSYQPRVQFDAASTQAHERKLQLRPVVQPLHCLVPEQVNGVLAELLWFGGGVPFKPTP